MTPAASNPGSARDDEDGMRLALDLARRAAQLDEVPVGVKAPEGSTLEYTRRYLDAVGNIAMQQPDFDRVFVFLGGGGNSSVAQGTVILRAKDWSEP